MRDAIEQEQVLIFNWLYDTAVQRRSLASDYHARLTDTLARRPPAHAATAMRQHILWRQGRGLDWLTAVVAGRKSNGYRTGHGLVEQRGFSWDEINGRQRIKLLPALEKAGRGK